MVTVSPNPGTTPPVQVEVADQLPFWADVMAAAEAEGRRSAKNAAEKTAKKTKNVREVCLIPTIHAIYFLNIKINNGGLR